MPQDKTARNYPIVTLDGGEILYRRGDAGDCMFLIQDGSVEMVHDPDVRGQPAAIFDRGDFFGEMAILSGDPRSYTARARDDTRLVQIDAARFGQLMRRNPDIAIRMTRKLSRRLSDTTSNLFDAWQRLIELEAAKPGFRLVHVGKASDGTTFPIPDGTVLSVGRVDPHNAIRPDLDLTEIDPHFSISRRHARILRRGAHVLLVEERATNGTFVDGERLEADEPHPLRGGEEVRFGGVRLQFRTD